jgi:hypothetical protein
MVSNVPVNSTILLQVASTHPLWDNNVFSTAKFCVIIVSDKMKTRMKIASQEGYRKEQPVLKVLQLFRS